MKQILFLLMTLCSIPLYGATDEIVRLAGRVESAEGKDLYKLCHQIFIKLYEAKSTETLISFPADVPEDTLRKKVNMEVAYYLLALPDYVEAIRYGEASLDYLRRPADKADRADIENLIAISYFRRGQYDEALPHAETSYNLREELHDNGGASSTLATMAAILLTSRQPEKALGYINRAIGKSTEAKDSVRMAIQYGMQSEIYGAMDRNDEALKSAEKAYRLDYATKNTKRLGTRLAQMGTILMKQDKLDAARDTLYRAIELLEQAENSHSLAITCTQMGNVLNRQGDKRAAIAYFTRALTFFSIHHDLYNECNACYGLYKALKDSDPKAAMRHLEHYAELRDSLYTQDVQREMSNANARFEVAKAEAESVAKDRNFWILTALALAVILVLVVILGIVAGISRHRKQRARRLLDERKQLRANVQQIREEQRRKDHFYTVLTHDIRTPLTILLGCSASLRRGMESGTSVDAEMPDRIERQVDGLLQLVTQLLDLACCQHLSPVTKYSHGNVLPVVEMLAEGFKDIAQQRRLEIRVEADAEAVEMDFSPDHLQKMLLNLLSNAVKYALPETEVRVDIAHGADGMAVFRVTNVGPGISEDDLPHLFDMFYCRPKADSMYSSGVGLSIVDRLAKACGGRVEVESAEPSATIFRLTLPMRQKDVEIVPMVPEDIDGMAEVLRSYPLKPNVEDVAESAEQEPAETGKDLLGTGDEEDEQRPIVLVVEDNPEIFRLLDDALGAEFRMIYAANGDEGLRLAQQVVPNVVMTDLVMPQTDGFEICRQLKMSDVTSHIPVFVITGRADHETRMKVLQLGAEAVLTKPFKVEEVAVHLRQTLRQRRILYNCYKARQSKEVRHRQPMLSQADCEFMERVGSLSLTLMAACQLSVEELSRRLGMSSRQFGRKINALTGCSAIVYITQIRMGRAMKLLKDTELPVNEIMLKCGYDSASNFSNAFKIAVGCSPTAYRRKKQSEGKEEE